MAVLDIYCIYWTVWDRYMQVLYLGRALRTKETLPDFLKWRRVTRRPLVFRGLTGSQRTPGFWGVTKSAHFIAMRMTFTLERFCRLYIREIVRLHGVPVSIVSDRDPRFTAHFWKSFQMAMGTRLTMSTAFHPQTDGQ